MAKLKNFVLFHQLIALGAVAFLTIWSAGVSQGAMSDCIDATCRITATDGGVGSGCVFEIGQGRVYVLTAAHVVGKERAVRCEFWRQGHQSQPLSGEVIARSETADAAIVALPEAMFGGVLPSVIPIAPREYVVPAGATLTSVGCANGTWSTGWKGHALGYSGADLHFLPTPANGRSGSAVFDSEGKMIVAVLRARTINDSEGIATSVQYLYDAFAEKGNVSRAQWRESAENVLPAQCPGGQCPAPTPYLLPYRYREQYRNQPQAPSQPGAPSPAWPTLPMAAAPSAPPVDLGPTNDKLDRIADLLIKQFQPASPAAPQAAGTAALQSPVDDAARKAADEAKVAATEAKAQSDKIADKFGKIDSVFEKFGGDPEMLIQRAIDRVSKVKTELGPDAQPDDVLKAYAKDLIKERLKEGISGLTFDKLVSVGGGIPAVGLAIFGCVVVWKLVNNKPLAIESIAPNSLAGKTAAELREHVFAVVEPLKNQIDAKFNQLTGVATEAKAAAEAAKAVSQMISNQTTAPVTK